MTRLVFSPAIQSNNVKERLTNVEVYSVERQFFEAIRCEESIELLWTTYLEINMLAQVWTFFARLE
jgi:hypothetical protein